MVISGAIMVKPVTYRTGKPWTRNLDMEGMVFYYESCLQVNKLFAFDFYLKGSPYMSW